MPAGQPLGGHDQWRRLLRARHLLLGCPQSHLVWWGWLENAHPRVPCFVWNYDSPSVTAVVQIVVYHSACLFQLLAGGHLRGGTRWQPASRADSTGPVLLVSSLGHATRWAAEVRRL